MEQSARQERRAARVSQEQEAAAWLAQNADALQGTIGVASIEDDKPRFGTDLVGDAGDFDVDTAADRAQQTEAEGMGATYRGEA